MLHVRTEMRSGAYASSCQDTDYAGPGDRQEFGTPVHDERYGLSDIGVCISRFQGRYIWLGPGVVEELFVGYNGL
jgi:hypothetical protein